MTEENDLKRTPEEPDPKEFYEKYSEKKDSVKNTEDLSAFLEELMSQRHGYSSICEAFILGMQATIKAMDRHDNGGITGFQHGWILGQLLVKEKGIKHGIRIVNYDDFCYPYYEDHFNPKTIPRNIFESIQKEVVGRIENSPDVNPKVMEHWKSIAEGKVPFGWSLSE